MGAPAPCAGIWVCFRLVFVFFGWVSEKVLWEARCLGGPERAESPLSEALDFLERWFKEEEDHSPGGVGVGGCGLLDCQHPEVF